MKNYADYIYTKQTTLDLPKIRLSCYEIEKYIKYKVPTVESCDAQYTLNTELYNKYNFLHMPIVGVHDVYREIQSTFRELITDGEYFIQCWLNIYKYGDFIDWHHHWPQEAESWHGFLCVDCEPSKTTYIIKGNDSLIDIPSIDGNIVISKSGLDIHRTWPWEYSDRDRITIAFDIVPVQHIDIYDWKDNWVPI